MNIIPAVNLDNRYEASFQVWPDQEPMEFESSDLVKVKNWMADHLVAFPSPSSAVILDHGTEGSPVLFSERN